MKLACIVTLVSLALCHTATAVDPCPPVHTWSGGAADSWYGVNVEDVGDIDGDGWSELCIGEPAYGGMTGRCHIYSGHDLSLLFSIAGENSGDAFGFCFDGGDLNGDGYSDLVVNAPAYDVASLLDAGRVYIFYGGPGPWASERFAADADWTIDGEQVGDLLGDERGVLVIDDVDGDSCAEMVLGADSWLLGLHPGRVYVYSGQTLDTLYTLDGENLGDRFGSTVRPGGDVNGDGLADLLVGAHHTWDTGREGPGHVYVYSAADGQLLWHLMSGETADAFGWGLDGIGDVNDDGYDDLAVGAHHWPFDGERHDTGRAYVFLGGPGPFPDTTFIDAAAYQFQGEYDFSNFGGTIRGLGDINLDGHDDYAITAYTFWPTAQRRGRGVAYVYSGLDGTEMFRMTDGVVVGRFGYGLASATDLDQDGIRDLWIGAPAYHAIGQVYCYAIGDSDQDTVMAGCDNCPADFNSDQVDNDLDDHGDVCDNCPAVGNPDQGITPQMTGDVNTDGTITSADIIYLVNYVFKGGASPLPCDACGDVNCDGSVTSADAIYLVNHVFKGGELPCDICQAFGLGWNCP